MTEEQAADAQPQQLPSAVHRKRWRISPLWLVPLAAAILVSYLGYDAVSSRGPTVSVTFKTADGLSIEQTQVKYKNVTLGTVQAIELGKGEDHVVVKLGMDARAESMLTDRARFWVVRPRLAGGAMAARQTGIETLVSGSYIELDPGLGRGAEKHHFEGLEQPPAVRSSEPGTEFILVAEGIGSIGAGSAILHRQMPVGEVLGFDLEEQTGTVNLRAFIRAPYDALVSAHTCFWNVSGLDVGMGAGGLHVEVASVRAIFSGGIAFLTPDEHSKEKRVEAGHSFPLLASESAAQVTLYADSAAYVAYFDDSVQGLAKGSAVKLFGMQVGNVTDLSLVLDPLGSEHARLVARVAFVLQPHRALSGPAAETLYHDPMREQVMRGLQVVLETSNYLTGEKALSLSYLPKQRVSAPREEAGMPVLPSHAGGLDSLTDTLTEVDVAADANWAEPLDAMLGRVLAADLALRLPQSRVFTDLNTLGAVPDTRIDLELQRLDRGADGLVLRALVAVRRGDQTAAVQIEAIELRAETRSDALDVLVAAMNTLLAELSDRLARSLAASATR